jgi:hypothetical protein
MCSNLPLSKKLKVYVKGYDFTISYTNDIHLHNGLVFNFKKIYNIDLLIDNYYFTDRKHSDVERSICYTYQRYSTKILNYVKFLREKIYDPENYTEYIHNFPLMIKSHDFDKNYIKGRTTIYDIIQTMNRSIENYRSVAEMTTSGQDMSFYQEQRIIHNERCRADALKYISKELIRIIKNCKNVLIEYDMLEEFKKYNPSVSHFFDLKECDITLEMDDSIIVSGTIMCALSYEANDKKIEKLKKVNEIKLKKEKEEMEFLYKKEFNCIKLFNTIEHYKMKSDEIYVEYKNILELKEIYNPIGIGYLKNTKFLDYFTNEKTIYLNRLISTTINQNKEITKSSESTKNNSNLKISNKTNECIKLIISEIDNNIISDNCGCKRIIKKGINKGKLCNKKIYNKDLCMNHYINT